MRKLLFLTVLCCASTSYSQTRADPFKYHAYVGGMVGYGSTTWEGLVPKKRNQNDALTLSTPVNVDEGGAVWGFVAGYELTTFFAIEANYSHYPDAMIRFDADSLFSFDNEGLTDLYTKTQTCSLSGKIMLLIPNTNIRAFSSAGVASVQRSDNMKTTYRTSPVFGFGFNRNINERIMAEIVVTYTAGYGESEINPVKDYVPFLYSVAAKLAYRF